VTTPNLIAGRYRRTDGNQHQDWDGVWAEDDLFGGPVRLLPVNALDLTAAPDQRAAVRARVRAIQQLRLAGVGPLIDLVVDGRTWAVTPVPQGRPLSSVNVGPEQVATTGQDLLRALAGLHAAGLAHGAIRPDTCRITTQNACLDIPALGPGPFDTAADRAALADLLTALDPSPEGPVGDLIAQLRQSKDATQLLAEAVPPTTAEPTDAPNWVADNTAQAGSASGPPSRRRRSNTGALPTFPLRRESGWATGATGP